VGITAVVITKNEERNINRCLASLGFCDEIIVVDSFSTDSTVEVAKNFTDRVYQVEWRGYVGQKNYGVGMANFNWILSLDADEEVSEDLKNEILILLGKNPSHSAFSVPRKTIHSGQWIKHGGWYPNRLVRLFDKNRGSWVGGSVHEYWDSQGGVGELKNDLIHYSFENIFDQVERNNLYSTLGARALNEKKLQFSIWHLIFKPIFKFFETYILKCGFLDGYLGFIIAVSAAYSVFLKWAKLWELSKHGEKS